MIIEIVIGMVLGFLIIANWEIFLGLALMATGFCIALAVIIGIGAGLYLLWESGHNGRIYAGYLAVFLTWGVLHIFYKRWLNA